VNERQDDWCNYLGEAELIINNARTSATKSSPNEILYGFKLRTSISIIAENVSPHNKESAPVLCALARANAEDASKHATYHIAKNYNRKHQRLSLQVGDSVYIRLGNGYKVQGIPKPKFGLQQVGPFPIVKKVGSLAYELRLPVDWKIHPVISIAQLEPAKIDPFEREAPPPPPITIEGEEEYEIEAIVRSAVRGRGRHRHQHYLVRWKGSGPESDEWIAVDELNHAKDLIDEYKRLEKEKMEVHVEV
jgi:hypothetical protein